MLDMSFFKSEIDKGMPFARVIKMMISKGVPLKDVILMALAYDTSLCAIIETLESRFTKKPIAEEDVIRSALGQIGYPEDIIDQIYERYNVTYRNYGHNPKP